jgi:membrane fusion protein, multidrug efflux system
MKKTALTLLLFSLFGCSSSEEVKKIPPVVVTAFTVEPKTIPATFEFVGVAKSSHPVEIRARVEGYLWSIDYTEGSAVKAGDLLFQLDPLPFEAKKQEAESEVAREKAILWRAQRSLDRMSSLFDKNAVSQRDLDNATASVLTSEAGVSVAKANLVQADLNLGYTRVTSPIDGLSSRAVFREGTLITPNVNGQLALVSVVDPIWVVFSISDNEMLRGQGETAENRLILPPQGEYTVNLEFADGTKFPNSGKVNFASPTLDPDTGAMVVRATFKNPDQMVLPGQFVKAYVSGAVRPNAIYVPQEALSQGEHGMYVFVIDKNNKVSIRDVEVGQWYGKYWIIKQGLKAGEVVVVDGTNKLVEGASVRVKSKKASLKREAP